MSSNTEKSEMKPIKLDKYVGLECGRRVYGVCKENGPLAHLVWILVFDDQHDQVGLICLQVFIL